MYKVVDSTQQKRMTPSGQEKEFYRVHITTDLGASGSIDVHKSNWNKAELTKILSEFAEELDLAFTLGGE